MVVLLIIWILAGVYTGVGVYLVIPITLLLLFSNERFPEMIIGFLFILILSDSLEPQMLFAKSFKNVYILLLFFFLLLSFSGQNKSIRIHAYFIPYFIFGIIGMFYSPFLFTSFQKLLSYGLLFIIVPNYVLRSFEMQGPVFFRNLFYFMFCIVIIGFLIRFYNFEIAYSHGGRLRGVFGNPNGLGIFMLLFFIALTIVNSRFPKLFGKIELYIMYIVMFYILYKTGSRAALLAVILFFGFNQLFKYSTFLGFFMFALLLISMELIVVLMPRIILWLGLQETFRMETLEQGSGRLIAWEFAWKNIQESLFIGRGFGFDEMLMRKNYDMLSKAGHEGGVHNTYLIIWLNTGLLGLLSYLIALFAVFIKSAKQSSYAYPALFAILLSINFEPWLAASLNPFTILFLIIITVCSEEISENNLNFEDEESIA